MAHTTQKLSENTVSIKNIYGALLVCAKNTTPSYSTFAVTPPVPTIGEVLKKTKTLALKTIITGANNRERCVYGLVE